MYRLYADPALLEYLTWLFIFSCAFYILFLKQHVSHLWDPLVFLTQGVGLRPFLFFFYPSAVCFVLFYRGF